MGEFFLFFFVIVVTTNEGLPFGRVDTSGLYAGIRSDPIDAFERVVSRVSTLGVPTRQSCSQFVGSFECVEWDGKGREGTGRDGTGRDWTGLDGTGRDWTGLDGTGRDWTDSCASHIVSNGRGRLLHLRLCGSPIIYQVVYRQIFCKLYQIRLQLFDTYKNSILDRHFFSCSEHKMTKPEAKIKLLHFSE